MFTTYKVNVQQGFLIAENLPFLSQRENMLLPDHFVLLVTVPDNHGFA